MDIRTKLINLRNKHGYTQQQVADKLNVGRITYARYENGSRIPHTSLISNLAEIYNVSTDYLLNDDTTNKSEVILTKKEQHLLKAYEQLSADESDYAKKIKAKIDTLLGIDESEDGQ